MSKRMDQDAFGVRHRLERLLNRLRIEGPPETHTRNGVRRNVAAVRDVANEILTELDAGPPK